ncbi:metal-dependent amidase/aminoacylase/carboxypeptidase [Penicillium malachiteum]|uniref:Metal-dependent amidase/aminoacylase/carboxypeptidase n=1 Tax=Penicillium malachiteum TaxID=1324776 RepID=A0AAD6HVC6_9EURO|nr:metal-dependent amidase/aminoacylase/carboxypeptidase [Penicillium malachiteum]
MTIYENLYRDIHKDPELSGVESHTASLISSHLSFLADFVVHTNIGGNGLVGALRNGAGKTVLIRAELDALPTLEKTNLPYASRKRMVDRYENERPVMHACGHDMNMVPLFTAAETLRAAGSEWSGTLIVLFQPDEEETGGAKVIIHDGLSAKVPIPDIMIAQHVTPIQSGLVAIEEGPVLMAADSLNVRVSGGGRVQDQTPISVEIRSLWQTK